MLNWYRIKQEATQKGDPSILLLFGVNPATTWAQYPSKQSLDRAWITELTQMPDMVGTPAATFQYGIHLNDILLDPNDPTHSSVLFAEGYAASVQYYEQQLWFGEVQGSFDGATQNIWTIVKCGPYERATAKQIDDGYAGQ